MAASTNQIFAPKMIGAENVMCRFKWDYPIVNLISGHIRNCCRTPKQTITADDLTKFGKDAIMNLPYELERRKEKLLDTRIAIVPLAFTLKKSAPRHRDPALAIGLINTALKRRNIRASKKPIRSFLIWRKIFRMMSPS